MPKQLSNEINPAGVSLADRLEHGNLTPQEVMALKPCGQTSLYRDIRDGKLKIIKFGSRTLVPGPSAARYIRGEA